MAQRQPTRVVFLTAVSAVLVVLISVNSSPAQFKPPKIRKPRIVENVQRAADNARERAKDAARKKAEAAKNAAKRAAKAAREKREAAKHALEKERRKAAEAAKRANEAARKKAEAVAAAAKEKAMELKEAAQSAPDKVTNSTLVEIGRGSDFAARRIATLNAAINAESARAFNVKNWEAWVRNPDQVLLNGLSRGEKSIRIEVAAGVAHMKNQWWYQRIQKHLLSLLLEKPTYVVCGENLPGPPIWYVNGILTTHDAAVEAGSLIALQLSRRVHVLHNPTFVEPPFHTGLKARGFDRDDVSECVYDRIWPAHVVSRLDNMTESLLGGLTKGSEKLQGNPTTRQLAYVLYHADEPVSVVTHSQGCLIARNAFFTMALLSSESKARKNVAWVAAGLPLNDNELWPCPKRTTILDYRDDPVPKLVGLRGGGIEYNGTDHDFMEKYVNQLKQEQIWPGSSETSVVARK